MSQRIGVLLMLVYFGVAAWAILWWMPRFFDLNYGTDVRVGFRYVAATLIPIVLLLLTAAFRQARLGGFSMTLLGCVLAAGALLMIALGELNIVKPSTLLSALHVLLCALFVPLMLFHPGWSQRASD